MGERCCAAPLHLEAWPHVDVRLLTLGVDLAVQTTPAFTMLDFRLLATWALFGCLSAWALVLVPGSGPLHPDFLPMWAAGKAAAGGDVHRVYDFVHITALQGWPFDHHLRPYVYPPTALLIFAPFGLLPFGLAGPVWTAFTVAVFAIAGRRLGAPWWFLLGPWVVFSLAAGQITVLVGGLLILGLTERAARPILAGALLAAAACLKPQLLVLAPLALVAGGDWRALIAAGVFGVALVGASAMIWGVDPWLSWLQALPRFSDLIASEPKILDDVITPSGFLRRIGVDPAWAWLLFAPAVALVWSTFRRGAPPEDQLLALVSATLMISPYALNYDLAILAPALAIYLSRRGTWFASIATCGLSIFAVLNLAGALGLALLRSRSTPDPDRESPRPISLP